MFFSEEELIARYPHLKARIEAENKAYDAFVKRQTEDLKAFMQEVEGNPQNWITSTPLSPR